MFFVRVNNKSIDTVQVRTLPPNPKLTKNTIWSGNSRNRKQLTTIKIRNKGIAGNAWINFNYAL